MSANKDSNIYLKKFGIGINIISLIKKTFESLRGKKN
jgi:hypothetical protein